MTLQNTSWVHVFFMRGKEKLPMGHLAMKDRTVFFEYDLSFIQAGLELSPFKLALNPGVIACPDHVFDGLFGVFNDSLPDGWGRLLLDRTLLKQGMLPGALSPLERLCYVGSHGMGALTYEPEIEGTASKPHKDWDEIAEEVLQFQATDDDQFLDDLLSLNGSSAGARPKILVTLGEEDWIIKFKSLFDPKDIGSIEYAYHLMAILAHLDVPKAKLFPSQKNPGYFGVQRFDRREGRRLHMHTVSGLLHVDHQIPCLDYETIMKTTLWLTRDSRECEKQLRASIFNVLSHNRDDHAKNFSFLMDEKGAWHVSPAYDLTFSSGPSGEHCTMIMGEGKNPTETHLLKLAEVGGISQKKALQIMDEVRGAILQWERVAVDVGVSRTSQKMIQTTLDRVSRHVFSSGL